MSARLVNQQKSQAQLFDKKAIFSILVGAPILAMISVVTIISFVAIIYVGPLAPYLGMGIAHTLVGATIMFLIGSARSSVKEAMTLPQDAPAILLASGISAMLAGQASADMDVTAATVAVLVPISALTTGIIALFVGAFRWGAVIRYVPHQVIAGFLAATGYLVVLAGLSMLLGENISTFNLPIIFAPDILYTWVPWGIAGVMLAYGARKVKSIFFMPGALLALFAAFYATLFLLDLTLADARSFGLLLGPFEGSTFINSVDPTVVLRADWPLVLQQAPLILAVVGLTLLGTILNISGLEKVFDRDLDTDKDLSATGLANIGGAAFGGMPGFQSVTEPAIAKNLGVSGRLPGLVGAAGCLLALVMGAAALGSLPVGVFSALLIFIGIDLLWTWLKDTWGKLSGFDYAVVVGIVIVAGTAGFLWAVFVGILAAIVLFLLTYAKIDCVRSRTTLASERSRVERPMGELSWLAENGSNSVILHLDGFIFFGTAHALRERVRRELVAAPPPQSIMLDFSDVQGLDVSAIQTLGRIVRDAHNAKVELLFVQVDEEYQSQIIEACAPIAGPRFESEKDAAVEVLEQRLLAEMPKPTGSTARKRLIKTLVKLIKDGGPVQRLELPPETILFHAGTSGREIYLLLKGQMRAEVQRSNGSQMRVAQFRDGALIGELAHYSNGDRTADVIAETDVELLRVDVESLERVHPEIASDIHQYAAGILARRLISTTALANSILSR